MKKHWLIVRVSFPTANRNWTSVVKKGKWRMAIPGKKLVWITSVVCLTTIWNVIYLSSFGVWMVPIASRKMNVTVSSPAFPWHGVLPKKDGGKIISVLSTILSCAVLSHKPVMTPLWIQMVTTTIPSNIWRLMHSTMPVRHLAVLRTNVCIQAVLRIRILHGKSVQLIMSV